MTDLETNLRIANSMPWLRPMEKFGIGSFWDNEQKRTRLVPGCPMWIRRKEMFGKKDKPGDGFTLDFLHCQEDMERAEKTVGITSPTLKERATLVLAELILKVEPEAALA